jgi:hypothetical protein
VIHINGGGEAETPTGPKANKGDASLGSKAGKHPKSATTKKAKEKASTGNSGASKATEEAYEPAPGVHLPKPEQKIGGECDPSVAGCGKNGKFEGTFFE